MKEVIKNIMLPLKNMEAFCSKILIVIAFFILYSVALPVYYIFGLVAAIVASAIISAAIFLFKLDRFYGSNSLVSIALSIVISAFLSPKLLNFLHSVWDYGCNYILEIICYFVFIFFALTLIFGMFLYYGALDKPNVKGMGKMCLCGGSLLFILLIYIPCDTYLNNFTDFNFPVTAFIFILIGRFILYLLPFAYLGSVLMEKGLSVLSNIVCGLTLCVFAQFMFMNQNLGLATGEGENWSEHLGYGIVTLGVWIVLLALPFILSRYIKKLGRKLAFAIPAFIGAMQAVGLIFLLIVSENNIFSYRNDLLDGRDQYTVSSKKNIVTFVFDAADNCYFDKLLETRPEVFDGLEDFTVYTNTCSVHDYTLASMTQMLTGTESCPMYDTESWLRNAWESQKTEDFYSRLHNAGYTVNGYMRAEVPVGLLDGKFDNSSSGLEPKSIDKTAIADNIMNIAKYRYMPYLLKRFFNIQGVDFKAFVNYSSEFNYMDEDYMRDLKLTKSNSDKNFFIVEHLNGPHPPCDDTVEETVNCLNIVKEYIRQLKEMNLYDDAFIIVTSDHGRHTSNFAEAAATPIFMVKEAGKTHEKTEITNSPQYHSDFLATYLYAAGIYTDSDKEIYGNTVFDFKENDQRERIWFDHTSDDTKPNPNGAACNVYYAYKYTGDADNLKQVINDKTPYEIIVKE